MSRRNASVDAQEWAEKKKQQLERAKQLREERKSNMVRVAEDQILGTSSKGFSSNQVLSRQSRLQGNSGAARGSYAAGFASNEGMYPQ